MYFPGLFRMPDRKHLLDEHIEMLGIRKKSIANSWAKRHEKDRRDTVRWLVKQAQYHKHMIVQLDSLPDMPVLSF